MGPSFLVITLTPSLSREPGEGVTWSRPDKGLFGTKGTENTENAIIFSETLSTLALNLRDKEENGSAEFEERPD
jgi:hypothetical protein